jgi:hypothetical protein
MGQVRSRKVTLTKKERAILVSFVFLPLERHEKGRRAAEIVRTVPHAFHSLYYPSDRLNTVVRVSNSCRSLVKKGYLQVVGRVSHRFERLVYHHPRGMETTLYASPRYALTESGFSLVLSWNWKHLPLVGKRKKGKSPFSDNIGEITKAFYRVLDSSE